MLLIVLIAWGTAWAAPTTNQAAMGMTGVSTFPDGWLGRVPEAWPEEPFGTARIGNPAVFNSWGYHGPWVRLRQGMFNGVSVSSTGVTFPGDDPSFVIDEIRTGWPIGTMRTLGPDDARGIENVYTNGIAVPAIKPLWLKADRRLPLWPIWPTFAGSVLVVLIVLELGWQLVTLRPRLRRRSRRKHGRCLACGYDLAGLDRCPECDTEVPD